MFFHSYKHPESKSRFRRQGKLKCLSVAGVLPLSEIGVILNVFFKINKRHELLRLAFPRIDICFEVSFWRCLAHFAVVKRFAWDRDPRFWCPNAHRSRHSVIKVIHVRKLTPHWEFHGVILSSVVPSFQTALQCCFVY